MNNFNKKHIYPEDYYIKDERDRTLAFLKQQWNEIAEEYNALSDPIASSKGQHLAKQASILGAQIIQLEKEQ